MKKQDDSYPMVGGSSLMVIFIVLCLTIFSLLTLRSAQLGKKLSMDTAETVQSYYEADLQAELILSQLRAGEIPKGVLSEGTQYSYSCPLSSTQELQVCVEVLPDGSFSILRWQCVPTIHWQTDESLPIWDGNQ